MQVAIEGELRKPNSPHLKLNMLNDILKVFMKVEHSKSRSHSQTFTFTEICFRG